MFVDRGGREVLVRSEWKFLPDVSMEGTLRVASSLSLSERISSR
jgi:hypothetical protein